MQVHGAETLYADVLWIIINKWLPSTGWNSPVDVNSFPVELMLCFGVICEEIDSSIVAYRAQCSHIVSLSYFFGIQVFPDASMEIM